MHTGVLGSCYFIKVVANVIVDTLCDTVDFHIIAHTVDQRPLSDINHLHI